MPPFSGLAFVKETFTMNSLRFLLVHRDPEQSEEIAARLAEANHTVLPTTGLDEAAEALTVERFDAVLMEAVFRRTGSSKSGLPEFNAVLRGMERNYKAGNRVPLIAILPLIANNDASDDGIDSSTETFIDAVLPEPIDPQALTEQVMRLAQAVAWSDANTSTSKGGANILDPDKFREQVGSDSDLMNEIITLFLEERKSQEPEMRIALESGNFELLSRLAHTIKGSLASLHAMRAREHAQDLELAAKQANEDSCQKTLAILEADLAELEPILLALRQEAS